MRIHSFFLTILASINAFAQVASVSNANPQRGEEVVITYTPDSTSMFDLSDEVYVQATIRMENYKSQYMRKKMMRTGNGFEYKLEVDPLASYYDFGFFDPVRSDRKNGIQVIPQDETGQVFRNSFMGVAYDDTGAGKKERELFPDNYAVGVPRWRNLTYANNKDSAEHVIKTELGLIQEWIEGKKDSNLSDESAIYALVLGHVFLKDFANAYRYYDLLLEKHPKSNLIEDAHSLYSYYLFANREEDLQFEERSMEFLKKNPTSAIGKRLIWQLDESEESKNIMNTFTKYWMEEEPDEVTHYIMHAKSIGDPELKKKYLGEALNKLFDHDLSVTHYYSWRHAIPRRLPRIIEGYLDAGADAQALSLISMFETNSSKMSAFMYALKGEALKNLNDHLGAFESFLNAESLGHKTAGESASEIYGLLDVTQPYEVFKEETMQRMFYEMDVESAPDFTVTDIEGIEYSLAELEGKAVVLNFWFIGCAPCIVEMPGLNELVEMYEGRDVVFLAFALDSKSSLEKFLKKKSFKYNVIPASREISDLYEVGGYPTHVLIDKKRNIRTTLTGGSADRHKDLIPQIDMMLKY